MQGVPLQNNPIHVPVLKNEAISFLDINPECTLSVNSSPTDNVQIAMFSLELLIL